MLHKLTAVTKRLSPGLRQIIGNTSWLLADKALQMALSLLIGVWVTRYLGPTQYGTLNYALTFVALFGAIATLGGIGTLVVRDITRDPSSKDETLGTAFALQVVGGIITIFVTTGLISLLNPGDTLTRWLVAILAAATVFDSFNTIDFWFQSQIQSKYTVVAKNAAYVFMCAVRVALIQLKQPLIAFAWARLAEVALGAVALVIIYHNQGHRIKTWKFSSRRVKELLRECWPLVIAGVAVYMYANIDQVMLGSILKEKKSELGFYAAAVKISTLFDFVPMVLASSTFPKLVQIKEKDPENYLQKLQLYFDISTALWLAVAIPISICAPLLVHILYGKAFAATAPVLAVYVWAQFGSNLGVARNTFLAIEGKLHFSLILSAIGAFLNMFLNLFLIPPYGAMGATVATLITYFVVIILLNFVFRDLRLVGTLLGRSFNLYKAALRMKGLLQRSDD